MGGGCCSLFQTNQTRDSFMRGVPDMKRIILNQKPKKDHTYDNEVDEDTPGCYMGTFYPKPKTQTTKCHNIPVPRPLKPQRPLFPYSLMRYPKP